MLEPPTASSPSIDSPSGDPAAPAAAAPPGHARPRTRWWLIALTVIELLVIVVLQRPAPPDPNELREDKLATVVRAPRTDPYILLGKLLIGLKRVMPEFEPFMRQQIDQPSFGEPDAATQVRIVMLLVGANEAKSPATTSASTSPPMGFPGLPAPAPPVPPAKMLENVEKGLDENSPLHEDIAVLRPLVEIASNESSSEKDIQDAVNALPAETREALKSRHGWFADVLLSAGDHAAPVRAQAESQAMLFVLLAGLLMCGVGLAVLTGVVLLIVGIVKVSKRRIRSTFAPPQKLAAAAEVDARQLWVRGLWLETVAVFLAGFLLLKVSQDVVEWTFGHVRWLLWFGLLGQWALLLCIFWPRVRGLSWEEWKLLMGWQAPRGVAREIGAGFCAYLAGLPIYFAMAIVVVVLMFIVQAMEAAAGLPPSPPPTNKITEIVGAGGPAVLFMVFLLATVWAPIVEESIFRGALYRALRGRFALLGAGFLSAAVFAVMHGYVAVQLLMVFTLGALFAVMREWRNSLIPSVTAHAMHNSFALTVMLVVGWFMRG